MQGFPNLGLRPAPRHLQSDLSRYRAPGDGAVKAITDPPRKYIADRIKIEDRGHSTPCWIWQLVAPPHGYGRICRKFGWSSHRFSYENHVGPIPPGLEIDHLCRVRLCCNPDHLEPVTPAENRRRAAASAPRTRRAICKRGLHKMTPENTTRSQRCRTCDNVRQNERRRARVAAK
jgi:hypothetical protein